MELEVKITNLNKEEIIYILSEAFKRPIWNKNNVVEIYNNLLINKEAKIINIRNIPFLISLKNLYKAIETFIGEVGKVNIYKYDLSDCDKILQYALFGKMIY